MKKLEKYCLVLVKYYFKSESHSPKKFALFAIFKIFKFLEFLKLMENAFYFILKAPFVLKIFEFSS